MPLSRREFLGNGLTFVSLGLAMPQLLMRAAEAAEAPGVAPAKSNKILVVIELAGGNDGLNTVIPYADANYAKARPNIGVQEKDVLKIGSNLGLHPGLKGLSALYEKGQLAVVNGVGYPNPNRSHFQSMDIWQSGNPSLDARDHSGWLARYFDEDGHYRGDPLSGVSFGSSLPLALLSQTSPASVIGDGYHYGFDVRGGERERQLKALQSLYDGGNLAGGTVANGHADFVRNVGGEVYASTQELKQAFGRADGKAARAANYPQNNGLANELKTIAQLISGGVSTRVFYVAMGGFDTHANQSGQHANLMRNLGDAVQAFVADLELQGRGKDVVVMTFSEFGRRVHENGSAGTDHGAASVLFVAGGGVRGGVIGDYPSLEHLDDGDLHLQNDFRSVYATLLDNWLGVHSKPILGGDFKKLAFV